MELSSEQKVGKGFRNILKYFNIKLLTFKKTYAII